MSEITLDSYPQEYARAPVYDRVPSVAAIERVLRAGMRQSEAMANDLPAAVRATL